MSGHNKWSTIKHKKGAADAKRGKVFTKIIKEITIAARMGGGDPDANPRLRAAISTAKQNNMPNDNIERAIKKGTGELEGVNYEECNYEGYGPGGVAILVETATDNKNRTTSEVRSAFTKLNGNLGANGCVSWLFHQKGQIVFESSEVNEDEVIEIALEAGAEDVQSDESNITVLTEVNEFMDVKDAFDSRDYKYISAELTRIPENTVKVTGNDASTLLKLVDRLDDLDDVTHVYANFDIDDSELESLSNN